MALKLIYVPEMAKDFLDRAKAIETYFRLHQRRGLNLERNRAELRRLDDAASRLLQKLARELAQARKNPASARTAS